MRKTLALLIACVAIISTQSCKKNDSSPSPTSDSTVNCSVLPYRKGTTIVYTAVGGGTNSTTFTLSKTINGINYVGASTTTSLGTATNYIGMDANENVHQYLYAFGDLPTSDMITFKPNQSVGASWSYTYASVNAPGQISYKYTYKVLKTGISFKLGTKTYTDCTQMQITTDIYLSGALSSSQSTAFTYGCGIGSVLQYVNGALSSTLTSYTY